MTHHNDKDASKATASVEKHEGNVVLVGSKREGTCVEILAHLNKLIGDGTFPSPSI